MSKRVLIIGATSAIAAEVAVLYAAQGARLHLIGRNPEKMVSLLSRLAGASVTSELGDLGELPRAAGLVERALAQLGGFDVVLIAHGTLGDQLKTEAAFEDAEAIYRDNLLSVVALLVPLANAAKAQGSGTLGVITSVAGERGRPRNYTYGSAKGALNIYLQGVRSRLFKDGVRVVTLKLGPVDTPMTTTHEKNLLFASPQAVAKSIVAALERGVPEAYVPWFWAAIMPIVRGVPERVFQWMPFLSGR